jgi:sigma-E factor negative regulatory protein RseB
MRRAVIRWLGLAAITSCLLPAWARAQGVEPVTTGALSATEARSWLQRVQSAARSANFTGTLVYSTGGQLSSSRVWHFAVGDQTYELMESLDGRQQRIARHNDSVLTLWPQSKTAVAEKREAPAGWSTTPLTLDPLALEQYDLRREANARVAGREAAVLFLEPRDALRYAQRLWADVASGLMLRADVLGDPAQGVRSLMESTAFSQVEIGVRAQPDLVLHLMKRLDGVQVLRPQQKRTSLEAEGWTLGRPVSGFKLSGCVVRGMETAGDGEPVMQAVFSDGLIHVSVFVEPYKPQRHKVEVQAQQGATMTLMQRRGEYWVTAVGDVPPATLKQFALALERRRP